jgi:F420-non-reducing hydrogenase small subunit
LPDICLVNQGYLCIGTSTRGGCGAPCPQAGHPCVGCRGPSDALLDKDSDAWFESIKRVFGSMTDIPEPEIDAALRSPQLSLFLFQFSDYAARVRSTPGLDERNRPPRPKEKML